ncbi:polysaccharide deacetylase [Paenibacillus rigui]|uniref:polysaccharide deacetylase n=1 Tax=Paenibacillus rigui TaxID=554312 RepID=UPI0015C62D85|nr:polysaccharide deacetylase [Paenibacillus rigui]
MQSCRPGVIVQRTFCFVMALLLSSLLIMPFSWNRIEASGEADGIDSSVDGPYAQLKAGQRVWKEKTYADPAQPTVYLTFDDGPSKLTSQVLDILKEEDVKATFFVLGQQVKAHPELVRQAVEEGHAIGNHTYNHVYKELYSNVETFWDQVQRTEQVLKEETGIRTRLVRAPGGTFGNFDAFYFYYLDQAGYEVHDWNIDSGDSKRVGVPASEIMQTIEKGPFGDQVILLMHDGTGHEQTVKALPDIIHLFKEKGYAFAPLTPEVRPNHFRAGKLTIPRSLSTSKFEQLLAEAEQHGKMLAMEAGQASGVAVTEAEGQPGVPDAHTAAVVNEALASGSTVAMSTGQDAGLKTAPPQVPLKLTVGAASYELQPGQYKLHKGHIQVPLRVGSQAFGAQIEWKEQQRTAVVTKGLLEISYDFSRHEQRIRKEGMSRTVHLPEMELREGTIWVPLRGTAEAFGGHIASFGSDNGQYKVQVDMQPGFLFASWDGSIR